MLTIEECLELGVLMTEEQLDFYHHPEGRFAVLIYGVPDPDRLYIGGPESEATIYQVAPDGEPADDRGLQACLLPVVMQASDQDELAQIITNWIGAVDEMFPVVHGWPQQTDYMYAWATDEVPITVAPWDLWPIDVLEAEVWCMAGLRAHGNSELTAMFELIDMYNGSDYGGEIAQDLESQKYAVSHEIDRLERSYEGRADQEEQLLALAAKYEDLRQQEEKAVEVYTTQLEQAILHPITGDVDAQIPPVDLPLEQAAIWRSLQSLSWRNWSLLEKQLGQDGDALYGSRFVNANRRLCPWY